MSDEGILGGDSLDRLEWVSVSSSNVDQIAYDPRREVIYVRFKNAATYAYSPAGEGLWNAFLSAGSKGQFVWQNLRDRLATQRV